MKKINNIFSNNKIKLQKIISILLILVLAISFSGCSPGGQKEKAPGKRVNLKIWRLFDSEEIMQPIINEFIQDRKDEYDLNIIYEEKEYSEYVEATTNALAAGQGPDIWMIRNDWVAREYDKLEPIPEKFLSIDRFKQIFPQIASNDLIIDNKIYGIPWSIDTLALYYNPEIFRKVRNELEDAKALERGDNILEDPPSNWEEFIRAVKLLTIKDGDKIQRAGVALGTANNVEQSIDILTLLMLQNHTQMISDDKQTATFNLAIQKQSGEPVYAGTKALEFYKSFSDPGKKDTYTWNNSMPDSLTAFIEGKTAMMINYSYVQKQIFERAPTFNYQIGPFPQIKDSPQAVDFGKYWVETVTNNCQNPEVAWDFINYVREKRLNNYLKATRRPAPNKIEDEDVPITKERIDEKNRTFIFQLNTAQNWYKGKFPMKIDNVFTELIENVTIRNQNPQSAIDAAANRSTTWLRTEPY